MKTQEYLDSIKLTLAISPIVEQINITQAWGSESTGFFRARLWLRNGDILEVSEFFTITENQADTTEYRYQWMDSSRQQLHRRWDNAAHHPDLPNSPHHVHIGNDNRIEPSQPMGIIALIEMLEDQLKPSP